MISITCPLCAEELIGKGPSEIESSLQDHMRKVHELQDMCILDEHGHPEGSIQECQPDVVGKVEGLQRDTYDRPVFEYSLEDQIEHMPPSLPHNRIPEKRMLRIRCPICGEKVEGTGDADLSSQLRLHFQSVHASLIERNEASWIER